MEILKTGLNPGVSNAEYHGDLRFHSSSDYKKLLENPYAFYEKKILGVKEESAEKDHLTTGTLVHSLLLEPHLVQSEYAIYEGTIRRGKAFEEFRDQNPGRTIVTKAQMAKAQALERAYKNNQIAVDLLLGTESEHTIVQDYCGVPSKVRCDAISPDKGYIVDVKTSAFPVDLDSVRDTIRRWDYGLSAALYSEIAAQYYNRQFEFYWLFLGTGDMDCQVYRMSDRTRNQGLARVIKATQVYRQCMATGTWPKSQEPVKHEPQAEILEV